MPPSRGLNEEAGQSPALSRNGRPRLNYAIGSSPVHGSSDVSAFEEGRRHVLDRLRSAPSWAGLFCCPPYGLQAEKSGGLGATERPRRDSWGNSYGGDIVEATLPNILELTCPDESVMWIVGPGHMVSENTSRGIHEPQVNGK